MQFIKDTYHPEVYKNINLSKHVAFYEHIINDFGQLNTIIYKKVEETSIKLIVHLIKIEESLLNKNIDPANILVVEIDTHVKSPNYLSRGLGALVCSIRNDRQSSN